MVRILAAACASVLALFFALSGSTSATETVTFDGVWWQSLTVDEQVTAVEGMLIGYRTGWFERDGDYLAAAKTATENRVLFKINGRTPRDYVGNDIAFGTIQQKISLFYNEHPEAIKNEVGNILSCAATVDCTPKVYK